MAAKRTHEQFLQELELRNINNPNYQINIKPGSYYNGLDSDMHFTCLNNHPDFNTKPRYILQKGSGCPVCGTKKAGNTNTKDHNTFLVQLLESCGNTITLSPNQEYTGTYTKLQFECNKGHKFVTYPKTIIAGHGCPTCDKINRSHKPIIVVPSEYISSQPIIAEFNKMVKNLQIDVQYIPINKPYDKYFYVNQLKYSIKNNKQTIFIFEDEWSNNKELVLCKLRHYSNQNILSSIHARKCVIRQISSSEKKDLLNNHHVQGNDNASLSYGAYYNNTLVSVMTFSHPRVAVGAKKHDGVDNNMIWELSRFCTDTKYRIPGIASKLLSHFKQNNEWSEIYSFADRRWSVGNMYHKLGFELVVTNPPAYFYVIDGVRKHRWNYRKDIISKTLQNYDASLTEYQNMVNHGFWRVWDCGSLKFLMKNQD